MKNELEKKNYMKQYRQDNKQKIKEYIKDYRLNNSEELKKHEKEYLNRPEIKIRTKERKRKYHIENKDKDNKYNREWRNNNKLLMKEIKQTYNQTEKGRLTIKKSHSKRRKLKFIPILNNQFPYNVEIEWHHINDIYVIAIPKELHKKYSGYKQDTHRELINNVIKSVYGIDVVELVNKFEGM